MIRKTKVVTVNDSKAERKTRSHETKIIVVVAMKGGKVEEWEAVRAYDEQLGGSREGSQVQISVSFLASPLADVIAGALEDGVEGLGLQL